MADGHGGYRQPQNPAPVSGPGALSRRTDGGPTQPVQIAPGGEYGSRKEMQAIQSGAAMAGGGSGTPDAAPAPAGPDPSTLTPLNAPTARPEEPITAGLNGIPNMGASQIDDATRERLLAALPTLLWLASQPKASEQTRQYVRRVRADL